MHVFYGRSIYDWYGISVAGIGDVNHDGHADVVVGAWFDDTGREDAGTVFIYSGRTGVLVCTITGESAYDQFGNAVCGLGNIDNDGQPDIGVAAIAYDGLHADFGRVYVFSFCDVEIDILPQQCPNVLDLRRSRRLRLLDPMAAGAERSGLQVAILGGPELNVLAIDTATVMFRDMRPVRSEFTHAGSPARILDLPCDCDAPGADGYLDLLLYFDETALAQSFDKVGDGRPYTVGVTGQFIDGRPFVGTDCLEILRDPDPVLPAAAYLPDETHAISLGGNVPNPFNASTVIAFTLAGDGPVRLEIYDILGRRIATLVDAVLPAGPHQFPWLGVDASDRPVASGIYLYRLATGEMVSSGKMVLLK